MTPDVLAIVWSPRRINEALESHEQLGFQTAFICGYTEHEGCNVASWIIRNHPAGIYLLSYDDQIVTRQQADEVLELQAETNAVVSGWQQLGMNVPWASAVHPEYGVDRYHTPDSDCYYTVDELEHWPDRVIPTVFFPFALTAIPRPILIQHPFRALTCVTDGGGPFLYSKTGRPYDKGMMSDWTLCQDLIHAGHTIWAARDAHVTHLAPEHNVAAYRFYTDQDEPGIYWNRRPR